MSAGSRLGLWMALVGTLILTPDAMLMRLSGMDGLQMVAWRGLCMGSVMVAGWAILSRGRAADARALASRAGAGVMACQFLNSLLFCTGIAIAPAAVVLLGIATVPVCAAVLGWLIMGERTRAATWLAIAAVMAGIVYAVSEQAGGAGVTLDTTSALGALLGVGVAMVLALNFVILRANPGIPIPLAIGGGALTAGVVFTLVTGPEQMMQGEPWAMMTTGLVVLPVSFTLLSFASRHTAAANVSLLMLLETVLGPLWVWVGVGEAPTARMLIGGAFVVMVLAVYIGTQSRRRRRAPRIGGP
ncbi:DMT family transporter [Roseovarius sp. SCSIO 43702]|uniref:DMT family transporter n=1 Tax=Roseovarius sp. SCSIO 43702 TaxID=2823043 RepID=UPI0021758966|nr:DMT family transporter [Roseovarius sp. SCSIO 43702]